MSDDPTPAPAIITITACIKLNNTLDLNELGPKIDKKYQITYGHKSKKKNEVSIITTASNTITTPGSTGLFYNCIGLKLTHNSCNISIKIFKNGSVLVTGLRDNSKNIITIIEKITDCEVVEFKYALIRSKYSFCREIKLNDLEKILNEDPFFTYCSYIPSHYRGLIAKTDIGSVSIFGTGMMLLSTKNFEDIGVLINKINTLLPHTHLIK